MGSKLPEPCQLPPARFISLTLSKRSTISGGFSLLLLPSTRASSWHPKGKKKKITGPSAASETHLITSTSFQRAPVVARQVYSNPGKCQTKAPLSSSVSAEQPHYFSSPHLLGGSRDYHNTGAGFGLADPPWVLQQAGAFGWLQNQEEKKKIKKKSNMKSVFWLPPKQTGAGSGDGENHVTCSRCWEQPCPQTQPRKGSRTKGEGSWEMSWPGMEEKGPFPRLGGRLIKVG